MGCGFHTPCPKIGRSIYDHHGLAQQTAKKWMVSNSQSRLFVALSGSWVDSTEKIFGTVLAGSAQCSYYQIQTEYLGGITFSTISVWPFQMLKGFFRAEPA